MGLAGTLTWRAGQSALDAAGDTTLVIVADPADTAISVYRSVGFTQAEHTYAFQCTPAE
jgi:hypothetical protein